MTENVNGEQPSPISNNTTPVWETVVSDVMGNRAFCDSDKVKNLIRIMTERDQIGRSKYGVPLQAFNGRDCLLDALQEHLDGVVYKRQRLVEIKTGEYKDIPEYKILANRLWRVYWRAIEDLIEVYDIYCYQQKLTTR